MKTQATPAVGDIYYHPATDRLGVVVYVGSCVGYRLAHVEGYCQFLENGEVYLHTWLYTWCDETMILIGKMD